MGQGSPQLPRVLAGRYELVAEIGRGAMGTVHRAFDREARRFVAVKALHTADPDDLYRLKNEFRSAARIRHPNLLPLFEMVVEGGHGFFTMEYIEGGLALAEHVRRAAERAPPDGRDAARDAALRDAFCQLALALSALHEAGKIHRDLKPSNVLVDPRGRVVLLDFGLVAGFESELALRSQVGSFVGTLAYMAPEQALGRPLAEAADWYSFGVLLYECLTGRSPFAGAAPAAFVDRGLIEVPPPESVAPGCPADLARLATALLAVEPAQRPNVAAVLAAVSAAAAPARAAAGRPPRAPPFVGRRAELERLRQGYDAVKGGGVAITVVAGSSGIGKTALLERFAAELARDGALVLRARCYPHELVPFEALDEAVDELSRYLASLPPERLDALVPRHASALRTVFPVLGRVPLPLPRAELPTEVEPHELRRRGFLALRELLARVADRRPLALWIDDLQWADADSEPLLHELLRPPDAPPILWLLSYRSEDRGDSALLRGLEKLLAEVPATGRFPIALGPLSAEECRELAERLAPGPLPASAVAALAAESGGSPFLLSELLRREDDGSAPAAELGLAGATGARLRGLPAEARRLLEALAVAAAPLERGLALAAAGIEGLGHDLLRRLEDERLLRAVAADGRSRVEIYHDQIREGIDAQLAPEVRRARHAALAATLERLRSSDVAALFEHHRGAGAGERAAHYARLAGDQAAEQLGFDQAVRFYRAALDLDPTGASERDMLVRLGDAQANAGRGAEAAAAFDAAARAAPGDAAEAEALRRRAAEQYLVSGHVEEGVRVLRPLIQGHGVRFPTSSGGALAATVARLPALAFRYATFRLRTGPEDEALLLQIDACQTAAKGLVVVDPAQGAWFAVRSLVDALRSGNAVRTGRGLCVVATSLVALGGPLAPWGRAMLRRLDQLAAQTGDPYLEGIAAITQAQADFVAGRFGAMLECCDRGASLLAERCRGTRWECDVANMAALRALEELGQIGELQLRLPRLLEEAIALDDIYAEVTFRLYAAFWRLARGDVEEARRTARASLARWGRHAFQLQHFYELRIQVSCDLYEGAAEAALARLRAAWPALRRSGLLRHCMLRSDALLLRARTALAAAESRRAPRPLLRETSRAARVLGRMGRPDAEAAAQLLRAALTHRRGDRRGALALLEHAEAAYARASMALHVAYARRRRGELLGGDAGSALVGDADHTLASAGIGRVGPWLALQAPGFGNVPTRAQ